MFRIESQLQMGKAFFAGDRDDINGGVTVEDLRNLATSIAEEHDGELINAKNIFGVMREVFENLDSLAPTLSPKRRREVAADLIHNIIVINRGNEVQAFTDRALLLLVDYSLDTVASETLAKSTLLTPKNSPPSAYTSPIFSDKFTRNNKADISEEMQLPSPRMSIALSKVAAENSEVVEKHVEEAAQYVRNTAIEVDEKIALAQETIHARIDQALKRVDEARDKLEALLEVSNTWSNDVQGQAVQAVDEFAEKIIEAMNPCNLDASDLQKEPDEQNSKELPLQEIIADQ